MRMSQILEGISSVLYHGTSLKKLASILDSNQFRLVPEIAAGEVKFNQRKDSDYMYFLSTARTKQSEFTRATEAIIRLDGRKLAQNYSGAPVNFFGDKSEMDESEDRIYSSKPVIRPASRYITGIEFHSMFGTFSPTEKLIVQTALTRGIPIKVYDSRKDMASNQRPWSEDQIYDALHDDEGPTERPEHSSVTAASNAAEQTGASVIRVLRDKYDTSDQQLLTSLIKDNKFQSQIDSFMKYGITAGRQEIMRYMRQGNLGSYYKLEDEIQSKLSAKDD